MIKKLLLIMMFVAFISGSLLPSAQAAYCLSGFPHAFYGDLTINEADAPVGTEIRAMILGVQRGTYTTTSAGLYGSSSGQDKLAVAGAFEGYDEPPMINFEVFVDGGWVDSGESILYQCGLISEFDINVEMEGPVDNDGDGYFESVDCNDADPDINPGATEVCNGVDDNCVDGIDEASLADLDCNDGVSCTNDVCVEAVCQNTPSDNLCDNGLFCDGVETCDAVLDCQAGTAIAVDDGVSCTVDSCNEELDTVVNQPSNNLCDNGFFCDGEEICDAVLDCQDASPVDCSSFDLPAIAECSYDPDRNSMTLDEAQGFISVCDEEANACTSDTYDFTHTCDLLCGAECLVDGDCGTTVCDQNDGCYGSEYRDYHNEDNTCSGCSCVAAVCVSYDAYAQDARCIDVSDSDSDGVPDDQDVCEGFDDNDDQDSDNVPDGCDICPLDADNDADSDGICGDVDNCPNDHNLDQTDVDEDGIGYACDDDVAGEYYETEITIYEGWTLFALPFEPVTFADTEELGQAIIEQGTTCDVVMTFDGATQQWIDDILGLSDPSFGLSSTEGYLIFCNAEVNFTYEGTLW